MLQVKIYRNLDANERPFLWRTIYIKIKFLPINHLHAIDHILHADSFSYFLLTIYITVQFFNYDCR